MKRFIVIVQTSGSNFKKLILKATSKENLYPMYRHLGVTYSIVEYSQHNNKMADLTLNQLKTLSK